MKHKKIKKTFASGPKRNLCKANFCWQIETKKQIAFLLLRMEGVPGGVHVKTQFANTFYLFTFELKGEGAIRNATLPFGESFLLGKALIHK